MKYYPKVEIEIPSFFNDGEDVLAWDFSAGSGKSETEVEWTYKGTPDGNDYTEVEWTYKGGPEDNGYTKVEWTYLSADQDPKDFDSTSTLIGDDFF